jgi:hypothetical protein
MMLVFDIETGPLPEEHLREIIPPFEREAHPGEFDPKSVKTGNMKDSAKIAEKIEAAREKHLQSVADYEADQVAKEANYWRDIIGKAALDPMCGQVLTIGILNTDLENPLPGASQGHSGDDNGDFEQVLLFVDGQNYHSESDVIEAFWQLILQRAANGATIVGHNIQEFDLPFLMNRSWINGIDVPTGLLKNNRYWNESFIDTREVWRAGRKNQFGNSSSLDAIGRVFGFGGKLDGVNGGDFHKLWFGSADDRAKAIEYLSRDLVLSLRVA